MFYEFHKQYLEELFVSGRKNRFSMFSFSIGITFFVVFLFCFLSFFVKEVYSGGIFYVSAYLVLNLGFSILRQYIIYVLDFDEPKPKEKRQKSSLTEIVLREWHNLIGGLNPKPAI